MACYGKGNPATKQEVEQMWKFMEPQLKAGTPIENMWDVVNQSMYSGTGKPRWIGDVLSGKKTPYKSFAGKLWKAQYESRIAQAAAANSTRVAAMGKVGRVLATAINLPRTLATLGHGVVFPVTHAGDLFFRPFAGSAIPYASLVKGIIKTYKTGIPGSGFFGAKGYIGRELAIAEHDPMYPLARTSGLDIGPNSHPTGILGGTKPLPSQRAWDALGVMRLDLWKRVIQRNLKDGMTAPEQEALGKVVADWANHATGSGKGPIANLGGNILFGPKLTQAKLNKLFADPLTASKAALRVFGDVYNKRSVSAADWASAQLRLSGMIQNFATRAGFLALNQAYLNATGDERQVNWADPHGKGNDYLQFKGPLGTSWDIPGEISEVRALARMVQLSFMNKRETEQQYRTSNRFAAQGDLLQRYATSKLTPTIQHTRELTAHQNFRGQPLPDVVGGTSDDETRRLQQLTPVEYAGQVGPIPLEGPAGYLSDELKNQGFSSLQANQIVKGLLLFAGGYAGFHGHADKE